MQLVVCRVRVQLQLVRYENSFIIYESNMLKIWCVGATGGVSNKVYQSLFHLIIVIGLNAAGE